MAKPKTGRSGRSDGHFRQNRRSWDRDSDEYDARHRTVLGGTNGAAWGLWRVPESSLRLLGPIRGKAILELGCGAARWSLSLARQGGRPVGLDVSRSQLRKARTLSKAAHIRLPLLQASAEDVPLRAGSFDVIFCDWGAMTFADPVRTVPECARLLRPGGRLVFATASPLRYVAFDYARDRQGRRLSRSYFDQERVTFFGSVEFQLPYGRWIELFRRSGLTVESLSETRPSLRARSTYVGRSDSRWARHWPMEAIWSVRKAVDRPAHAPRRR